MDNWMLPMVVLLANGKNANQQSSSDVVESLMVNELPKGPRSVLTVTQAVDRSNQLTQQQKAGTQRELDLATLIHDGKLSATADLSADPRMQFMLQRISDPALKSAVIEKLKGSALPANEVASRRGTPPGRAV